MTYSITRKTKSQWTFLLACIFTLSFTFFPEIRADQGVDWGGWGKGGRSLSLADLVSATYNETHLYIEIAPNTSDIQIRILDGVTVVYETTLYAPDTFIAIPLEQLEDGTYGLELTNQWGDYLYGEFEK